jgi:hypothetical protein
MYKYNSNIELDYKNIIKNRNSNEIKYSDESWNPIDKPIDKIKILNDNNIESSNNKYQEELEKRKNEKFELNNEQFELNNNILDSNISIIDKLTLDNFKIDNTLDENKLKESISNLDKLLNYIKIL